MISFDGFSKPIVCILVSVLATQVLACGSDDGSQPAALGEASSSLMTIGATTQTTVGTGIVRWQLQPTAGGLQFAGIGADRSVVSKMSVRRVDKQDGKGPVIEVTSAEGLLQIGADGRVLEHTLNREMFNHLRTDLDAYRAKNEVEYSCFGATIKLAAETIAVIAACATPEPAEPLICLVATGLYADALNDFDQECGY